MNSTNMPGIHPLLDLSDEVAEALHGGQAVVALESNVITHGRTPDNASAALQVEQAVRSAGAVPATVWVDGGRIHIGMSTTQVDRFATTPGIPKVSSRDLPVVLARGGPGAATIASCLVAADLAGISFLASAGLGGVHRGAELTMDISSDLIQLTRSKVAVVCAGAKSILDLRLTMEYLETQCVPLVSFRYDDFPAFYCRSSGIRSPHRLDDEDQVACTVHAHWALGNRSAVLITTPVREQDAVPSAAVEAAIDEAVHRAEQDGVHGNDLTKYLMAAVDTATGGKTAQANLAVLVSTAATAGLLATAYADRRKLRSHTGHAAEPGTPKTRT